MLRLGWLMIMGVGTFLISCGELVYDQPARLRLTQPSGQLQGTTFIQQVQPVRDSILFTPPSLNKVACDI